MVFSLLLCLKALIFYTKLKRNSYIRKRDEKSTDYLGGGSGEGKEGEVKRKFIQNE